MAYQDLREFVRALEKNDELKRIPFEVDPRLEITEFADRAVKQGGPALLFERPTGYQVPVLVNAFASTRKMEIALEVNSVEEVARRIVEFLEMRMPEGLIGKLKMLPKLARFKPVAPPATVGSLPAAKYMPKTRTFAGRIPSSANPRSVSNELMRSSGVIGPIGVIRSSCYGVRG